MRDTRNSSHISIASSPLHIPSLALTMDVKSTSSKQTRSNAKILKLSYWILLILTYASLLIGSISSSLLSRFYFVHGGSSRWVTTWVQSAGFPFLLLPIHLSSPCNIPFKSITFRLLSYSIFMGVFLGINNLFISWGVSYLPVSTSSLLLSSQLTFNLFLSILLVKQKITFNNIICVILLTLSSILIAFGSNSDRPNGVTQIQFFLGFITTLAAALMFAIYLPIMEIIYKGVKTYNLVIEMQFLMEATATAFSAIGMAMNGGFGEMEREGKMEFDLGEMKYWMVILATIISWQMCFMGTAGMIFLTSSLNSGICMTALLSMNVLGGVVVFRDQFGWKKALSLVLCLVGFSCYLYGEYKRKEEEAVIEEGGENQNREEGQENNV